MEKKPGNTPPKTPPGGNGNNPFRRISFWLYFLIAAFFFYQLFSNYGSYAPKETTWNDFENKMLANDDVAKIDVINKEIAEIFLKKENITTEKYPDINANNQGPHYYFTIGSVEVFESKIQSATEKHQLSSAIEITYSTRRNWMRDVISWMLPLIILVGIWIFIFRRMTPTGRGGMNPFDFGKSKPTLFDATNLSQLSFKDVAGLEEAKVEIKEIVNFLKNPEFYNRLGAKIPKGVMLVGPPGTGKTLLAKAVAGEAKVPFFHMSGSEFVEMFVGVGASRVRDLFKKAKEKAPSIIFIDEIDAIGRIRGGALSMRSNDERESTLNQLLTEMDGFDTNSGVIVLAATNRADILDRALLRPGRFDRHIYLELPDLNERKAIFKVHLRPLVLAENIDIDLLAAQTPGFSGADIANICNEAALIAARHQKDKVEMEDFMSATDRIIGGLEKKSKIISPEEKKRIAFHEAGHATTSWFLEHADTLMKVTIVPRGKSLGAAWYLPEEHLLHTKAQFLDRLTFALGGRAAEEVVFGEVSSGALDDLEKVTKQAYTMVAYYGLDEKIGNISYYDSTGQYEQSIHRPYSEATARMIDQEVRILVEKAYQRAKKIIIKHRSALEELAHLLMEKEVVIKDDLIKIFGEKSKKSSDPDTKNTSIDHENVV